MNFGSALANLKEGRKVCRRSWPFGEYVIPDAGRSSDGKGKCFVYHFCDGKTASPWTPFNDDLFAEDWVVLS